MEACRQTEIVNKKAQDVWGVIKQFDKIEKWHELVSKSSKQGNKRTLLIVTGDNVKEEILKCDDATFELEYKITDTTLPFTHYHSYVQVEPNQNNTCKITWRTEFDAQPEGFDQAQSIAQMVIEKGLMGLERLDISTFKS